jgi:beta-mannanase
MERQGSLPVISWGCAPTAEVNSGSDDSLIAAYARSLKAFGHPVFLRWFWEMNLNVPKKVACIGSAGPAGFVTAWQRVWRIFHSVGASNVAFVWCPGIHGGLSRMAQFFPGAHYVDWIGVDGYDRRHGGHDAFAHIFGAWYAAYSKYGKPMMIGETGAHADKQVEYLQSMVNALPQFPLIKAVVYFDAHGTHGAWQFGSAGLQAFRQLAHDSYFAARG